MTLASLFDSLRDNILEKPMEAPEFEFTDAENETIGILASRMKWVGYLLFWIGGGMGLVSVVILGKSAMEEALNLNGFILLLLAVIFLLTGIWTRSAAKSFLLIVKSTGRDIPNLMDALSSLLKLYYMQFWLIIDSLIALVVVLIILVTSNLL